MTKKSLAVLSLKYISKDAALEEHIADVGDNPVELLGYNPIKASIEVNLKAEFISEAFLQKLSKDIEIYPFVENVAYQQIMISDLNTNVKRISLVLLLISLILVLITVILINNTIRISIYSKRFVINTMKTRRSEGVVYTSSVPVAVRQERADSFVSG